LQLDPKVDLGPGKDRLEIAEVGPMGVQPLGIGRHARGHSTRLIGQIREEKDPDALAIDRGFETVSEGLHHETLGQIEGTGDVGRDDAAGVETGEPETSNLFVRRPVVRGRRLPFEEEAAQFDPRMYSPIGDVHHHAMTQRLRRAADTAVVAIVSGLMWGLRAGPNLDDHHASIQRDLARLGAGDHVHVEISELGCHQTGDHRLQPLSGGLAALDHQRHPTVTLGRLAGLGILHADDE